MSRPMEPARRMLVAACVLGALGPGTVQAHQPVAPAAPAALAAPRPASAHAADRAVAPRRYGALPLAFEVNRGQAAGDAAFLARGAGYTLFLTGADAVLAPTGPARSAAAAPAQWAAGSALTARGHRPIAAAGRGHDGAAPAAPEVVRIHLLGANRHPRIVGVDRLAGRVDYFIGNDPRRWRTDIPTYGAVAYRDVYRGVDLVYRGSRRQLEYDFVVRPGADPRPIALSFPGASGGTLDAGGGLLLRVAGGTLRQAPPYIYQQVAGGRRAVPGRYVLARASARGGWAVRLAPGRYDRSRPLVIDPPLSYATYLGGGDYDTAFGVAVDGDGSAYIAGYTCSGNFPRTASLGSGGGPNCANGARTDAYVTKLNAAGSAVVYSAYLGGSNEDVGHAVAVDGAGDAYVAGSTNSTDFPATIGSVQQRLAGYIGANDVFVAKLAPAGNGLLYATYKGGGGDDYAMGIAVDSSRDAFVTGFTASNDFGTTANAAQPVFTGSTDAFLFELDASAQSTPYSTYLGGQGSTDSMGVALDDSGNAYIVGFTNAPDLPLRNAYQTSVGQISVFVAKFAGSGALVYSTYLGGDGYDFGYGIAVDSAGDAFVTGLTSSTNFPTSSYSRTGWPSIQDSNHGGYDAFVTELGPSGSSLVFGTYLGGSQDDYGWAIALDGQDDVYVSGWTASRDFPSVDPSQATYGGGAYDAFAAELVESNPPLQGPEQILYSTYLGGSDDDHPYAIAVDANGNAYVAGATASGDFPTLGAFQGGYQGGADDAFVAKVDPCGKGEPPCYPGNGDYLPPPLPNSPQSTYSYYVPTSVTDANFQYVGQHYAHASGLIIFDFGGQSIQNGVDGTHYPLTTVFISNQQILAYMRSFIDKYAGTPGAGFIRLVLGTNNSNLDAVQQGQTWANLVASLNNYINSKDGYSKHIVVYGGSDIEPGYDTGYNSFEWAEGYDQSAQTDYYNYGSCDGCPNGDHFGHYGYTQWAVGNPPRSWTLDYLYQVSGGIPSALELPQIFVVPQADQWEEVALYAAQHYPGNTLEFDGAFTDLQACIDRSDASCNTSHNVPDMAWKQLFCALNYWYSAVGNGGSSCANFSNDAAYTTTQNLPYSSNIRWNYQ